MAKKEETVVEETTEEVTEDTQGSTLFSMARKVLLANIGAVAMAQDEVEAFINKLIERGEVAEKEGRKLMEDIMAHRKKQTEEVGDELSQRIESVLNRMTVPTKKDIDSLSTKITKLGEKIDELVRGKK
ncbi:MAG: hypothetical protein B6242_10170 [Anaerolineaceae bacterium 4572_78]|nr:MAG: hypothetical protein B6242_10170 [Anaerolineaceae bacterium 4572_78]